MYPTITSQVSFQLLLKRCMACCLLIYPTMSWRVLFPIAKHFMMLTLKHYKVIKDCVETLRDCNLVRQDISQRREINHFPSLRNTFTCTGILGNILHFKRKGQNPQENQNTYEDKEEVFTISTFDGRTMYKEIFDATQGFDVKFCIGEGGYGIVYKAQLLSGDTFAVKKLTSMCDGNIAQQKEFLNEISALTEIWH